MNSMWWRKLEQLDNTQRAFLEMPVQGRYLLEGPPGSGKTNLLLLRAQYLAGTGEKNVLIITYTKTLANFIRSGPIASQLISTSQIKTYHSWAFDHIRQYLGNVPIKKTKGDDFDEADRVAMLEAVIEANKRLPSPKLYSAIFVDEAQDLTVRELDALLCLSDRVCICGDKRQGVYKRDGLDIGDSLNLARYTLKAHYRIGQRIAHVADRLLEPSPGERSLEETSNYNAKVEGASTAEMHQIDTRDGQFASMLDLIRVQLDAFSEDSIGVFCGKRETLAELRERFDGTDLASLVCVHGVDSDSNFGDEKRIHVITMHSAKGTEFRSVHMFAVEELKGYGLNHRELGYTAITRARTALNAFRTDETNKPLEAAFALPSPMTSASLFSGLS
ncbi:superfamily I DNA/RNA helicase [Robbsia andropogonis]|uniref:DNA 3'-5' helicase II n=1 Tax=Robbsia andropogonis TaxID=28092 RepID=A0A0F5K3B9_9BURK|nr:ATP-dependent helicase [Robbsia andropogonis]KKB64384.1 superfamily I DNA/RNA helicase [Robbsia andropogonis]